MTEINEFGLPTSGTATRMPRQLPTVAPLKLRVPAFLVDVALHLAVAISVVVAIRYISGSPQKAVLGALAYPVASLVHRVIVQRFWHTTVGKRLFGLEMVRTYSDRPLTLWYLTKWWALSIVGFWVDGSIAEAKDGAPAVVRRT